MKKAKQYTFSDAVRHFRATHMQTALKGSTRDVYDYWLETLLMPRFGWSVLDELGWTALSELDAELVAEEMAATTRVNIHCAFRSTLRTAAKAGLLKAMPALPPLPKVGRKVPRPMRRDDLAGDSRSGFTVGASRVRPRGVHRASAHADLATTQLYADLDANDLRSAIERIDGDGPEKASRG